MIFMMKIGLHFQTSVLESHKIMQNIHVISVDCEYIKTF